MTSGSQAGASGAGGGAEETGAEPPSPEQIEERLRAQRVALAASVDELAARVDPRTQAREAGEHLREQATARADEFRRQASTRVSEFRQQAAAETDRLREQAAAGAGRLREEARRLADQAEQTWERARQGDAEATSALAKAAAVAGGVVSAGILLTRLARR